MQVHDSSRVCSRITYQDSLVTPPSRCDLDGSVCLQIHRPAASRTPQPLHVSSPFASNKRECTPPHRFACAVLPCDRSCPSSHGRSPLIGLSCRGKSVIVVLITTPSISPLGLILLCSAAAPLLLDLIHAHMLPLALLMQTELLIVAGNASALAPPFLRRLCRLRKLLLSPLASRTGE